MRQYLTDRPSKLFSHNINILYFFHFSSSRTYCGFLPVSLAKKSIIIAGTMCRKKHNIKYSFLFLDNLNIIGQIYV